MNNAKFRSRKFFAFIWATSLATFCVGFGWIDGAVWGSVIGAGLLFYTGGNVGDKYAQRPASGQPKAPGDA